MVIYTPKSGAIFKYQGKVIRWNAGVTLIEEGAAILKGREHLVKPVTIHYPASRSHKAAAEKPAEES